MTDRPDYFVEETQSPPLLFRLTPGGYEPVVAIPDIKIALAMRDAIDAWLNVAVDTGDVDD